MAAVQPTNLEEYCKVHNCSLFSLSFPCIFCKHPVGYVGLAEFHFKNLNLVYKDNVCYASCSYCLKLTANYELENYYRCSVEAACIEHICKLPLKDILVRCILCYKQLDLTEKFDCVVANSPFVLVRKYWRNYCRICFKTI
uniref:Protein E6 n=1 Tax=Human papillomavirus TaxID=10566 RepID=A0A385PL92_9PAPI|nr:MAG: E6 protein [Human papillomavirus]